MNILKRVEQIETSAFLVSLRVVHYRFLNTKENTTKKPSCLFFVLLYSSIKEITFISVAKVINVIIDWGLLWFHRQYLNISRCILQEINAQQKFFLLSLQGKYLLRYVTSTNSTTGQYLLASWTTFKLKLANNHVSNVSKLCFKLKKSLKK